MSKNYFATFGSEQLQGFKIVNPIKTAVMFEGYTENELIAELRKHPFNNEYCTTYPLDEFKAQSEKLGIMMYDLNELRSYYEDN